MSLDREPRELEQIATGGFVAKDPPIVSFQIQFAPVAVLTPLPGFAWMGEFGVTIGATEHKLVQALEGP